MNIGPYFQKQKKSYLTKYDRDMHETLQHAQLLQEAYVCQKLTSQVENCMYVCSNGNPLHYYVLRVPRKVDRWR